MKTTVEIADEVLARAKKVAAMEKTTLRVLIEEGLRWVLTQRRKPHRFHLRDRSVPGQGVAPGVTEGSWEPLRDMISRGHGT